MGWMKEVEEKMRQLTSSQCNLKTITNEITQTKAVLDDLASHESDMKTLIDLSKRIVDECQESKIEQHVSSIQNRYHNAKKVLTKHMDKLQKVFQKKDSIEDYEKWLNNSKEKLKEFENISAGISETKISNFKLIIADKENGSVLLEKAIETGENIFSEIAPNDREKIRTEIRALRDGWENHIDYMNSLNKTFETLMLEKSTHNERLNQIKIWLNGMKPKVTSKIELGTTLTQKKSILMGLKTMQQEIASHLTNIDGIYEKTCTSEENTDSLKTTKSEIEDVNNRMKDQIRLASSFVEERENYIDLLEKAKDIISTLTM